MCSPRQLSVHILVSYGDDESVLSRVRSNCAIFLYVAKKQLLLLMKRRGTAPSQHVPMTEPLGAQIPFVPKSYGSARTWTIGPEIRATVDTNK
jgi:hypothetical protein